MGRRIVRMPKRTVRDNQVPETGSQYWDRLKNLIPAEVSALYVAGSGVVPADTPAALAGWALFCLICTVIFIMQESKTVEGKPSEKHPVDWAHVSIASFSFLIWVYALGGPFASYGLHSPWLGTLLMLGWTFLVPLFYKGTDK